MTNSPSTDRTPQNSLRLWPGVVIVALQWLSWFVVPAVVPGVAAIYIEAFGRLFGGVAILIWWAFFSRAPRSERWGGAALLIVAMAATWRLIHESIATAGMGLQFFIYAIPILSLAFVVWALASRNLSSRPRRATMVATVLVTCGAWTLLRTDGITGDGAAEFAWRWTATPEERLLGRASDESTVRLSTPATNDLAADWPGFRGAGRDGVLQGVRIDTDWSVSPPVELWRRPIGPGWSSFAVRGNLFYTQEQRGDDEIVACHDVATGEPVWRHLDAARFWDSHAGAGPRATPTLHDGRVYTLGATGILNALDATDGTTLWSRNAATDAGAEVPGWGFASSPLVLDDLVVVHAGTLVAYDLATGDPRWFGPAGGASYSSPHRLTIDGVEQILQLSGDGVSSVAPTDGSLLWEHSWPGNERIVQPALTADGDVLIGSGVMTGIGMRRIDVTRGTVLGAEGWTTEERWTSTRLKSYFNDFVVHDGHAFGFDRAILACIDVSDGKRRWKGGRYGHGQLLLLADQDLLLVLSEKGELALVSATPDAFTELARHPAVEGKTWNHPVLVGDVLLIRNGEEMVAFRLTPA